MLNKSAFPVILFIGLCYGLHGQKSHTISGYVSDLESGEKLIQANVFDLRSETGTVTNTFGFFSLSLPGDSVDLAISYVGYQTRLVKLFLDRDMTLNFDLSSSVELEAVEVVAEEVRRIEEETQMSVVEIPIKQIKKIPALLGEVDVLKALQLLPGVQSGGEGQSGLYVRGGSPDQNLILLDGVPVYNASHLFGFFSVFNADAIKDVKLIKGGFPARYGGRLSSVIDITMKDGHKDEYHGNVTVGVVASKATIEGPILKEKTTFLLSARRTYLDILARPFIKQGFEDDGSEGEAGYYFYDVNAKINHRFSDKDRLYLSVYNGKDKFNFEEHYRNESFSDDIETDLDWGNTILAARWNHLWTPKLFSNATMTYSQYGLGNMAFFGSDDKINDTKTHASLAYDSGIRDWALKVDWDFLPNPDHFIRFGGSVIHHQFLPGKFDLEFLESNSSHPIDTSIGQATLYANELALFVEDDYRITEKFKANIGLHSSAFLVGDKTYFSLQPRLSARYLLPGRIALKASYAAMQQYIHLLAFEGIGLPTDLWLPTTERVKPQQSHQVALGLAKTFDEYEISLEGYYKTMDNVISYKEGAGLFQFNDWQDRITQGDGESYGVEFFVQKRTGRFTGWLGYTLSWSYRQFDDLNSGEKYPFRYDRRHDISLVGSYDLTEKIRLSGTWVYGTGNAITLAGSKFYGTHPYFGSSFVGLFNAEYYGEKNNFRMGSYHRMDVGVDFIRKRNGYERKWSIGAYNSYNRKNPFFLFYDTDFIEDGPNAGTTQEVLKQASLFPIIPYVTYSLDF